MTEPRWIPPPAGQAPTSGFAIASLILGLLGVVVLSVIFGIVALRRIKRRGLRGRALAIGGLVASGLWTLVIGAVVALAVLTGAERTTAGEVTDGGSVSVDDLRVGDCLNDVEETDSTLSVDVLPCGQLHDAEVVSSFDLPDDRFPGQEAIFDEADKRCGAAVSEESVPGGGKPFYFAPNSRLSYEEDRGVICVLLLPTQQRGRQTR